MKEDNWLDKYTLSHLKNEQNNILSNTTIQPISGETDGLTPHILSFPIVKRVSASTLGLGSTRKSKEQQLREDRLNKIRQIEGKIPNVILPDDDLTPGLISVKPMSAPSSTLLYMDFKYGDEVKKTPSSFLKKKILNILEMLKKNI